MSTVVGVDIGSTSLRAVEVEGATKARPTVVRFAEVALSDGAANSGEVVETHTVAAALKQLWSTGGFKSKRVILGMGNQRVIARDFSLPKMSRLQIQESLPFQVQDMLPMPVADALLGFYPVSEGVGENGPVLNGLLVAAVKSAVLANVNTLQVAGLSPVEVDLIPFALTRVQTQGLTTRGTVAVVDVGAATTNVVIVVNGVPQFVRIIPSGGDDVTKALVMRSELAENVADQAKRALGLATGQPKPEHRAVLEVIHEVTFELLNSVRNTLSYFVNARQQEGIGRIILSGGGSRLHGLDAALSEITKLPVSTGGGFADVQISKTAAKAEVASDSMSVALGLALGSKA